MTREEASRWIKELYSKANTYNAMLPVEMAKATYMAVQALSEEPRTTGVWAYKQGFYVCSECSVHELDPHRFCPSCGAKMNVLLGGPEEVWEEED